MADVEDDLLRNIEDYLLKKAKEAGIKQTYLDMVKQLGGLKYALDNPGPTNFAITAAALGQSKEVKANAQYLKDALKVARFARSVAHACAAPWQQVIEIAEALSGAVNAATPSPTTGAGGAGKPTTTPTPTPTPTPPMTPPPAGTGDASGGLISQSLDTDSPTRIVSGQDALNILRDNGLIDEHNKPTTKFTNWQNDPLAGSLPLQSKLPVGEARDQTGTTGQWTHNINTLDGFAVEPSKDGSFNINNVSLVVGQSTTRGFQPVSGGSLGSSAPIPPSKGIYQAEQAVSDALSGVTGIVGGAAESAGGLGGLPGWLRGGLPGGLSLPAWIGIAIVLVSVLTGGWVATHNMGGNQGSPAGGGGIAVKINSVNTYSQLGSGSAVITPTEGYKYVVYDVTVKDLNRNNFEVNPRYFVLDTQLTYAYFSASDASNYLTHPLMSTTTNPGDTVTGQLAFQIPQSETPTQLEYNGPLATYS